MLRLLMRLTAHLPLRVLHASGTWLGWILYAMSPTYRRHMRENLDRAGIREARTRRAAVAEAGKLITELPAIWFRPVHEVTALVRVVEGEAQMLTERARGKALLFLAPHLGCFEVTSLYAATMMPLTVLYRPPKIAALRPILREGRERSNVRLAPADLGGVRKVVAALKRGEAVGVLPDQAPSLGEGEWTTFFGTPAYTMTFAAKLAQRSGLLCYLIYARRLARGAGYDIAVRRYPDALPGESATRRLNRALEEIIRECPEQYLWGYNRYKTPGGAKPQREAP